MSRKSPAASIVVALFLVAAALPALALDLAGFEKKLTQIDLDNGLTVLIYERHTAPVVSFFIHVDVGSAQEVAGITGLAHMFEHMAFKGTSKIGTSNYSAEKKALVAVDEAYAAWSAERNRPGEPDPARLEAAEAKFREVQEAAGRFIKQNEFTDIISAAGGSGLNAFTGADVTGYTFSLPANKVELWAYLDSERFLDPVFREFYKERDVVQEERRMRVESSPQGRMMEQFLGAAFLAHPYGRNIGGHMSDLQSFTREDARDFYAKHYVPANMTISIVGDVDPKQLVPMVKRYFGRLAARPEPPELRTKEPEQIAEKVVKLPDSSQPMYLEGYHRPAGTDKNDAAYEALSSILSTGRTSRLNRSLVQDKKIAAAAISFNGFPGSKYPNLILFLGVTTPGHTNEEVQEALHAELERMKTEPVSDEELRRVKTQAKAELIRSLASNDGIALQLASYHAQYGDWRELFRSVDRIENVNKDDIMGVARSTFKSRNRTVAMIVNEDDASN